MGLFSKIKKAVGGLLSGAKKVFKSVAKVAAKVLSNKFVRGALMIATLVVPVIGMASAGWSAAAGQGVMSQIGGALGNVAKGIASKIVSTVTAPIKMLASGGSKVAGMFNANGLASTLSNASKTVGGLSNSLFGNVAQDSMSTVLGKMGLTGAEGSGFAEVAAGTPAVVDTAAGVTESVAGAGEAANIEGMFSENALNSMKTAAQAGTTGGGLLSRAGALIKNNPAAAMMGFSALQSAMAPDEEDILKARAKHDAKERASRDAEWNSFGGAVAKQGAGNTEMPANNFASNSQARAQTAREFINSQNLISNNPLLNRVKLQGA